MLGRSFAITTASSSDSLLVIDLDQASHHHARDTDTGKDYAERGSGLFHSEDQLSTQHAQHERGIIQTIQLASPADTIAVWSDNNPCIAIVSRSTVLVYCMEEVVLGQSLSSATVHRWRLGYEMNIPMSSRSVDPQLHVGAVLSFMFPILAMELRYDVLIMNIASGQWHSLAKRDYSSPLFPSSVASLNKLSFSGRYLTVCQLSKPSDKPTGGEISQSSVLRIYDLSPLWLGLTVASNDALLYSDTDTHKADRKSDTLLARTDIPHIGPDLDHCLMVEWKEAASNNSSSAIFSSSSSEELFFVCNHAWEVSIFVVWAERRSSDKDVILSAYRAAVVAGLVEGGHQATHGDPLQMGPPESTIPVVQLLTSIRLEQSAASAAAVFSLVVDRVNWLKRQGGGTPAYPSSLGDGAVVVADDDGTQSLWLCVVSAAVPPVGGSSSSGDKMQMASATTCSPHTADTFLLQLVEVQLPGGGAGDRGRAIVHPGRSLFFDLPHLSDGPQFPELQSCLCVQVTSSLSLGWVGCSSGTEIYLVFGSSRTGTIRSTLTTRVKLNCGCNHHSLVSSACCVVQVDNYLFPSRGQQQTTVLSPTRSDDVRARASNCTHPSIIPVDDTLLKGSLKRMSRDGAVFQVVDRTSDNRHPHRPFDLLDLMDAIIPLSPGETSQVVLLSLLRDRVVHHQNVDPEESESDAKGGGGGVHIQSEEVMYVLYETHSTSGRRLHLGCWSINHPSLDDIRPSPNVVRPFLDVVSSCHIDVPLVSEFHMEVRPDRHFGLGLRLEVEHRRVGDTEQTLSQCTVVSSFKPHPITHLPMQAEESGLITAGDELVAVGGVPLRGKSLHDVIHIIRSVLSELSLDDATVQLVIRKSSAAIEQESVPASIRSASTAASQQHRPHQQEGHGAVQHLCPVIRPYRAWRLMNTLLLPSCTLSADFAPSIDRFLRSGCIAVAAVEDVTGGGVEIILRSYHCVVLHQSPVVIESTDLCSTGPLMKGASAAAASSSSSLVLQCWPEQVTRSGIYSQQFGMVTVLCTPRDGTKGLPSLIALYIEVRIDR